jgi:hypothetical protein
MRFAIAGAWYLRQRPYRTGTTPRRVSPSQDYFPAIQARIREEFSEYDEGAVRHAANKITNEIRRGHFDCYYIEVSRVPLDDDGYYVHFEVEASGVTVYVRVTVD